MKNLTILTGILLISSSLFAQSEVENAIKEASEAYKNKKYMSAQRSLQAAIVEVNNKVSTELQTVFPPTQKDWEDNGFNNASSNAMGMLSGGISVEKNYSYNQGETSASVRIAVTTGSPMITTVMMMINNPMMAGNMGKSVKINGEKALERFEAESQSGEINFVIDGTTLITISGNGITDKSVMTNYAQGVDLAKLRSILSE